MLKELEGFSFLLQAQELATPVVQRLALAPQIKILGSYGGDGRLNGVALWAAAAENAAIYSVEALDEAQPVVQELLTGVAARAKELGAKHISWTTCWTKAKPQGMAYKYCYHIFRFSKKEMADWVMLWNFQAKVLPLLQLVARRGYETRPLSEATEAQKEEMKAFYHTIKPQSQYLDDILDGKDGKLPDELNYFTVLGEQVVGFSLVTELNAQNCLLRYRMSHPEHPGAMLLGFYATLNGFINSAYEKIRINVKENNLDTLQMMKKHMKTARPVMYVLQYEGEL